MLPVVMTQSSPTNGTNANEKAHTLRSKRVTSSKIPVCLEKNVHGMGDCKRPASTPGIHKVVQKVIPLFPERGLKVLFSQLTSHTSRFFIIALNSLYCKCWLWKRSYHFVPIESQKQHFRHISFFYRNGKNTVQARKKCVQRGCFNRTLVPKLRGYVYQTRQFMITWNT